MITKQLQTRIETEEMVTFKSYKLSKAGVVTLNFVTDDEKSVELHYEDENKFLGLVYYLWNFKFPTDEEPMKAFDALDALEGEKFPAIVKVFPSGSYYLKLQLQ